MLVDKWHPVTHDFGLIQAPLEDVVSAYISWQKGQGTAHIRRDINTNLEDAFESLAPLARRPTRKLFVSTTSDWVAFYQNGVQGSDPYPVMCQLASQLNVFAMRVCSTETPWIANIWEVYASESMGGSPEGRFRTVAVAKDGARWIFDQLGEPYSFERPQCYRLTHKSDRFTRDMLCEYVSHFNIHPFVDSFHCIDAKRPAVRLDTAVPDSAFWEYSLEEVTAGVPWRKK